MKFITSVFQRFRLVFRDTFEWLLPEILTKVKLKNVMNHIPKFAFCISIQFQRKQKCKLQILLCYNTCHNTWHAIFYNTCHLKKGKEKNWEKIGESTGQGKLSFAKLPRWVCNYKTIINIDSILYKTNSIYSIPV